MCYNNSEPFKLVFFSPSNFEINSTYKDTTIYFSNLHKLIPSDTIFFAVAEASFNRMSIKFNIL